jgi:hypothetical protein
MNTETKPMTIHIQLVGRSGEVQGSHTLHIHGDADDMEATISTALIKLLRHSWSMLPGDTLKIVEG